MKFVIALVAIFSLSQIACAKPNYQDAKPLAQNPKPENAQCPMYFQTEDLCANYDWVKKPTEDDVGSLTVKFWKKSDASATDPSLPLKVLIWMPEMGHGSSPTKLTKQDVGQYLVENVFFSMRGDWQIRFQLMNGKTVVEEQIADVTF